MIPTPRLLLALVLCATLGAVSACSAIEARLNTQVQAVSVPDLQAALADATAAGDTDGAACWSDVLAYVNALPTAGSASTAPVIAGVASAIEAARNLKMAQPIAIPPIPPQLHRDCAVVVLDAQQLAIKLGLTATVLAHPLPIPLPIRP